MTKVDNLVLQVLMSLLFSLIVVRDDDTVSQCYNNVWQQLNCALLMITMFDGHIDTIDLFNYSYYYIYTTNAVVFI